MWQITLKRTTNVLFFIAFANPLTVLIFHISGMCLRFFAGVRITRIRFWHGCKTWFGIAGASTTFLIAIDLLVLIASQFDIPRKKGYTVSFYTGYKMSNIKPGIYNSSNFSSAAADFNIRINIIGHFHFYVLCHAWRIFCFSKINFSDRSSRKLRN